MTVRLYQYDAYRRECTTVVTGVRDADGRPTIALAETVFYAAAGGQLPDRGVIAGFPSPPGNVELIPGGLPGLVPYLIMWIIIPSE